MLFAIAGLIWMAVAVYGGRAGMRGIRDATADLQALATSHQDGQQVDLVKRRRRRFTIGLICETLVFLVGVVVVIPGTTAVEQIVFVVGLFAAAVGLAAMMNLETHDRDEERKK